MNKMDRDKTLSWETKEYVHRKKSADWFWVLGIIVFATATASVVLGNVLLAILFIIGGTAIALFATRPPLSIAVVLSRKGVLVGNRLYPFSSLTSFAVSTESLPPLLVLETKNPLIHRVVLPIQNNSPDDVRLFLLPFVDEQEQEPDSFIDRLSEYLGF